MDERQGFCVSAEGGAVRQQCAESVSVHQCQTNTDDQHARSDQRLRRRLAMEMEHFQIPQAAQIYLDATYSKVAVGTLVCSGDWTGSVQLYKATAAYRDVAAAVRHQRKVTTLVRRLSPTPTSPAFPLQGTAVLAQSDQLTVAEQPLDHPLYGTVVDLDALRPDLAGVQAVARVRQCAEARGQHEHPAR